MQLQTAFPGKPSYDGWEVCVSPKSASKSEVLPEVSTKEIDLLRIPDEADGGWEACVAASVCEPMPFDARDTLFTDGERDALHEWLHKNNGGSSPKTSPPRFQPPVLDLALGKQSALALAATLAKKVRPAASPLHKPRSGSGSTQSSRDTSLSSFNALDFAVLDELPTPHMSSLDSLYVSSNSESTTKSTSAHSSLFNSWDTGLMLMDLQADDEIMEGNCMASGLPTPAPAAGT